MERRTFQVLIQEWLQRKLETGVRRAILDKILAQLEQSEVEIISGVRRCGKTTLLFQVIESLKRHAPSRNILYINFEDERLHDFSIDDFERLLDAFYKECQPAGRVYFFLDEVQEVPGWEKWVRRIHDQVGNQIKFFVTGSSSFLLSSEFATLLTGRNLTFILQPFSFGEFLHARGVQHDDLDKMEVDRVLRAGVQRELDRYLNFGGFPAATPGERTELLQQYFRDILFRDVAARYEVRDIRLLERLAHYLMTNVGCLYSSHKLSSVFGASKDTLAAYVTHLEMANLVFSLPYFSYSLAAVNRRNRKVYVVDTGLRNSVAFRFSTDTGRLAENAVYLALTRLGARIFYWMDGHEIDFVVDHPSRGIELVNVSFGDSVPEREWQSLREEIPNAGNIVRRVLITQEAGVVPQGIDRLPLWRYLLEAERLV
ncbi:MAG: ATP-binding protein [Planctomycetes bacterium]|nr:ATP-binding protein [Planctomycetota bacterium]